MCLRCGSDEAQLERRADRFTAFQKHIWKKNTEREGRGAERKADWRIGAHSEGVEKSLHLNAPLHPNSSAATKEKKKKSNVTVTVAVCSAQHSVSEHRYQTHTCPPCIEGRTSLLIRVYLLRSCGVLFQPIALTFREICVGVSHVNSKYSPAFFILLYKVSTCHITSYFTKDSNDQSQKQFNGITIGICNKKAYKSEIVSEFV